MNTLRYKVLISHLASGSTKWPEYGSVSSHSHAFDKGLPLLQLIEYVWDKQSELDGKQLAAQLFDSLEHSGDFDIGVWIADECLDHHGYDYCVQLAFPRLLQWVSAPGAELPIGSGGILDTIAMGVNRTNNQSTIQSVINLFEVLVDKTTGPDHVALQSMLHRIKIRISEKS